MTTSAGAVCGSIVATSSDRPLRFVYFGMARMGALDNGGAEIARMHDRLENGHLPSRQGERAA